MPNRKIPAVGALVATAAVVSALVAIALPATSVAGVRATRMPRASGHLTKVIVMLRDRPAGLKGHSLARRNVVRSEEAPMVALLRSHGAKDISRGKALPFVIARVSAAQRRALARNSQVLATIGANTTIPLANPPVAQVSKPGSSRRGKLRSLDSATGPNGSAICGTANAPENDPEAVNVINAPQANQLGYNGAGVKVAYIAGSIDPTIPDFQRNAKYASPGSPAGSPVVTPVNFSGDPANTPDGDVSIESFLDASSIASQGNSVFNLDDFISTAHSLPSPCDITVTGAAPGASVYGLDVFSDTHGTTQSNFLQAIDWAVANGVNVINESFGANNIPDTALDVTRIADDDAVAAGVTVVTSTGDAGVTNTTGSPATDPNLISVGASTTFRQYEQNWDGGVNATTPNASNGTWLDNNISSLSSGGFSQSGGNTVDLVAPGDSNWIDCSTNTTVFQACLNESGQPTGVLDSGGTSESSPLTAGAAADVIQAYESTHNGAAPTPAQVKQILMSTATDTGAPAEQQGAGLLNVLAAVNEATSLPGSTSTTQAGGLLVSPNQINISQNPNTSTSQKVHVTNTGTSPVTVNLSTRTFTHQVASHSGSFCLNPSSTAAGSCGPPTANTFQIWSGVTEVYQEETFTVPKTTGGSRLNFSSDYQDTGQGSLLHIALYDPSGAYAGYSSPQGLADYANIQISNPKPGTWTAVFFTEQDGATPGGTGTTGNIQWRATTYQATHAGSITPSSLTIAPGATQAATFTARSGATSGDAAQSIVLNTTGGATNSIPVTVRTLVPVNAGGGSFDGVLTGGNGRGAPAQESTYVFTVPAGKRDIDISTTFADSSDGVVAFLQNPEGETVASSSNITTDGAGHEIGTGAVNIYKDSPQAGTSFLTLDWLQPVSGNELVEPFKGTIRFNQVNADSNLPAGSGKRAVLRQGHTYTFKVSVKNTGKSPQEFFLDPRTNNEATLPLASVLGPDQGMTLPLAPGAFPAYIVPPDTTEVRSSISGSAPVTYDIEPFPGDPDLSPAVPDMPGVTASQSGNSASLDFTPVGGGEVSTGLWYLNPSEIGPYGGPGNWQAAPAVSANASFAAVTPEFDPTVTPSTGDFWSLYNGYSGTAFAPVYLKPGQSAQIPLTITPTAAPGSVVTGTVNLDDVFQVQLDIGAGGLGGDELAALPFRYRVSH